MCKVAHMANKRTKAGIGGAAVIALCVPFLTYWEGTDLVAKRDAIGTGHPITYCHGQTDEFGKVKAGDRFTPAQCDALLAKSLPKYLAPLQACIKVAIPDKAMGAALDAAYNAGDAAVCHSPMVAKFNAGDIKGGCEAFAGWYVRAAGNVVRGLVRRREAERKLCLEGVNEPPAPAPKPSLFSRILSYLKGFKLWH